MEKIKINKKFLFTEGDLLNYLKTITRFTKTENEILATLTYKKAYDKLNSTNTLVSFPYKQNRENEIAKRPLLLAKDIGEFIKKYAEENSPIDSILINPTDNRNALIRPLQIKYIGKGSSELVTDDTILNFIKRKSHYENNNYTLVLVLEGNVQIKLRKVVDWLKSNSFPFSEVVLIHPDTKKEFVEFFQLKPSNETFSSIKIDRKELLSTLYTLK